MSSKLSQEQAQQMLRELSDHFQEPVQPISSYCQSLMAWANAVIKLNNDSPPHHWTHGHTYYMHLNTIMRDIMKSNLLYRLIYEGQKLRSVPCPTHQGSWSGCVPEPCPDGCSDGSNVTGWLPAD